MKKRLLVQTSQLSMTKGGLLIAASTKFEQEERNLLILLNTKLRLSKRESSYYTH